MAYLTLADAKRILKDTLYDYGADADEEIAFAETYINGRLAGHYPLPFDDTSLYAAVPTQITWIGAYLVGYKLWDAAVPLEGQTDDTAAARWKKMADEWLDRIAAGDELLVLPDGTVIQIETDGAGKIRFYPSGTREKAPSSDNEPFFTRAQAHNW